MRKVLSIKTDGDNTGISGIKYRTCKEKMVKQKNEALESPCKSTLRTLEDYMTKIMFTLALSLLISGCEDMKMDRKDAKRLQPENQVSQHDEDQAKFLP